MTATVGLLARFSGSNDMPASVEAAFDEELNELVVQIQRFDAIRLVEAARIAYLPMAINGSIPVDPEASAALVELVTLIALADNGEDSPSAMDDPQPQEMSQFLSESRGRFDSLLHLAQLKSIAEADSADKLAMIALLIRASEVVVRNPSYPEMAEETNLELFEGNAAVRNQIRLDLGFTAADAYFVLGKCNEIQNENMSNRFHFLAAAMKGATSPLTSETREGENIELARSKFFSAFESSIEESTVAIREIVEETGLPRQVVDAVISQFHLDLNNKTASDAVDEFITGNNPLRAHPILTQQPGRVMLPHSALNSVAIRDNLEDHLKKSPSWSVYAKHRGDKLEERTRNALTQILPGAHFRNAFEYFVPATDKERDDKDPSLYTKRVEGDHLITLDDIAIIVEDKAVALSVLARGGRNSRIRADLTGIITKASDQAGRVRERIEQDGGLRVKGENWVDLRHIREIHTVAVSLDDISAVLAATAQLVQAELLPSRNIPWTVSLHDLELISQLIDRPASFLLYLRRRRQPDVTVMFKAADELDLFLHFLEGGLWVEPDPAVVRAAYPYLPAPSTAEMRRYREQQPAILTSRTDQLDKWFYARDRDVETPGHEGEARPTMIEHPVNTLVDELQTREITGWLSIGAMLLNCSEPTQKDIIRFPSDLLDNPKTGGPGRSLALPMPGPDPAEGWLTVIATLPPTTNIADEEKKSVTTSGPKSIRWASHAVLLSCMTNVVVIWWASTTTATSARSRRISLVPLEACGQLPKFRRNYIQMRSAWVRRTQLRSRGKSTKVGVSAE